MPRLKTKIKLLDERAAIPERAHKSDTGYDLTFIGVHKIVGDVVFFKTGVSIEPPSGYYFEVVPRSSISKLPLSMANSIGVIDEHYRGEILIPVRIHHKHESLSSPSDSFAGGLVRIFNSRPQTITAAAQLILREKPRLFQAILRKRNNCDFIVEDVSETDRGDGGFGSTD